MDLTRWVTVLVVLTGALSNAQDAVSLVALPLHVDPWGFKKEGAEVDGAALERVFQEVLATESNLELAARKEVDATMEALACSARSEPPGNWMGRFAFAAGRLYGLYVSVRVTPSGQLEASGSVARDDGEMVVGGISRAAWSSGKAAPEQVRGVLLRLLGVLQLDALPAFRLSPTSACVFDGKLRERVDVRVSALNRRPLNSKAVFARAYDEVKAGLVAEDCARTIAGLERMERAAAPSAAAQARATADSKLGIAGPELIGDQYREYVQQKQQAWGRRLSVSDPVVKKANADIESGMAAGNCRLVREGLSRLGHAAGNEGVIEGIE